jgi:hypothetical protein
LASFFSDVASINKFYFPEPLTFLEKRLKAGRRVEACKEGCKEVGGNPDSLPGIQISYRESRFFWLVGRV